VALDHDRLVGWAFLPFDFHQTPLLNVYYRGRLIACGLANRTRPVEVISGPRYNWFEISWKDWSIRLDRSQLARLVLQRGEDGQVWGSALDRPRSGVLEIDDLVEAELFDPGSVAPIASPIHRFPARAIVELYYLDYLGRAADPGSVSRYSNALE